MMKEVLIGVLVLSLLVVGVLYLIPSDTNDSYDQPIREKNDSITEKMLVDEILNLDEDALPNEGYPPEE